MIRHAFEIWKTSITIDIPNGSDVDAFEEIAGRARDFALRVDQVFSTYREDSLVTAYRHGRWTGGDDKNSQLLREVIEGCKRGREITDGAFDPWAVPGGFDPSGYVKGWAAEKMTGIFVAAGFSDVCVNAGGDVVMRGSARAARPGWSIGVRHPENPEAVVKSFQIMNGAMCTSGMYERGQHIIDPRNIASHDSGARESDFEVHAKPADQARSASVIGPKAGMCEILSTALIVAGRAGAFWVTSQPGYQAFVIDFDSDTTWSVGRSGRVKH